MGSNNSGKFSWFDFGFGLLKTVANGLGPSEPVKGCNKCPDVRDDTREKFKPLKIRRKRWLTQF